MALPILRHLQDCADFSLTVSPFLPQLYSLPDIIVSSPPTTLPQLKALYLSTNPLVTAFAFALFLSPIFWLVSEINKNYSQVDRAWSILPTVYNAHYVTYAHLAGLPTQRLDTVMAFSVIWSMRLTYNYWRKGGYKIGTEDYRWESVKAYAGPIPFAIFNIVFIALVQNVLLWLITTPTYIILLVSRITGDTTTTADLIFSRALMGFILLAFFADQQQWSYQRAKAFYQQQARSPQPTAYPPEDLQRGFIVTGLWAWSRHPNFFAEQATWATLYQWATYKCESYANWTLAGVFAYLMLFQASTWLTELLSARKYPEYKEYQLRVGKFLPRMSTALPGEEEAEGEQKAGTASSTSTTAADSLRQRAQKSTETEKTK